MTTGAERRTFLDNIRWQVVLMVVVYHVFYMYNAEGVLGGVGSFSEVQYQDIFLYAVYPWFMFLLFLIAGICARYSLEGRTVREFVHKETLKLLVPSTAGLFVYHWITGYMNISISGSWRYMSELPTAIKYVICAVSGIGPLWFIQTLWLFSMLLALICRTKAAEKLYGICGRMTTVAVVTLIFPVYASAQVMNVPVVTVYIFGIYGCAYFLGYFVFSHDEVQERLEPICIPLAADAVATGISYVLVYFGTSYAEPECLKSTLTAVYLWLMSLAILGCGRRWNGKTSRLSKYMTSASFGIYIVHYPIVLALCMMMKRLDGIPIFAAYAVPSVLSIILSAAVYELLKRIPVIRLLIFGIGSTQR